jgi:molybdate transport system ATP-binding protein
MSGAPLDARVVVSRAEFGLDAVLKVASGEVVAVMGPSGAGKSTLLGVLAGLIAPDEGHVRLGGRTLDAVAPRRVRVAPAQRGIVLLAQEPRLFPHLSAHANIAFGLRVHGASRAEALRESEAWLARVGLDGMGTRRPSELSGGQQQRVALARALATSPEAILLDEPLTSLDAETAGDVRALLHEQLAATRTTTVVATHDAVDAVALASRLVVLEEGRVTQSGPARDVLAAPATRFAAAVAGVNRVVGSVAHGQWRADHLVLDAAGAASALPRGTRVAAVFRPAAVRIDLGEPGAGAARQAGEWGARVTRLEQTPAGVRVRTAQPEVSVDVAADRAAELGLAPGLAVRLSVAAGDVRLVPL